jgi:hypothetical protein
MKSENDALKYVIVCKVRYRVSDWGLRYVLLMCWAVYELIFTKKWNHTCDTVPNKNLEVVLEDGAERRNALDYKYVLSLKALILVNFLTCVCVCVIVGLVYVLACLQWHTDRHI